MTKTGSCLCGAVNFTLNDAPSETGACHCSMCRKWSGGIFLGVVAPPGTFALNGEENLSVYPSSDWAERAFCKTCGSNLFYRVTAPGPHQGTCHFGLGTLDDAGGITLTSEIFIDEKPAGYSFAGDTAKMTGAEVFAMFAPKN